jgi:cyclohexanone monooxygenase
MSQLPHDALKGAPIDPTLPFDPAALADKYLAERDKRLQWNVGTQQYQVMEDGSEPLGKDFWTDNKEPRSPVTESRDALVVGGGFGGLLQAIALIKRGVTNIRIIERGGDFGGTW